MAVLLNLITKELSHARIHGSLPSVEARVEALCSDSRKASAGCLFICIQGFVSDGHNYAPKAYEQGARYFLTQRLLDLPDDAYQIVVTDTRIAQAQAAAVFYGHPEREMRLVGITGTKGKTTTALFLQKILNDAGQPTGYIGTNGIIFGDKQYPTANSTPDSLLLYAYLREMLDAGITTAVMEISSQGLKLHRVHGLIFHACVFTNLSPDHIGSHEHPDFEDYAACKRSLFTDYPHLWTVCNLDDPASAMMTEGDLAHIIGISAHHHPQARWCSPVIQRLIRGGIPGMEYACAFNGTWIGGLHFLPQPGEFNIQNALCALAVACDTFGIPTENALRSLEAAVIPGRFESLTSSKLPHVLFVIDYAHNAVSLSSMLDLLRAYHPTRLICLFGSVGERTKERRRELAQAAGPRADLCILTADNPGREDPMDIIQEIDGAFPENSCPRVLIPDRSEAVAYAVRNALPGDVILLAGKGHEMYQLIGTEKQVYHERDILLSAIQALS